MRTASWHSVIKAKSTQTNTGTRWVRKEKPNKVVSVAKRIRSTNVFADLPAMIAANPPITPDANIRPTDANIPTAIKPQPGNCLWFHQYTETRNMINNIRPTNIPAKKSVVINPTVANKPGMIANKALFHDNGKSSRFIFIPSREFMLALDKTLACL